MTESRFIWGSNRRYNSYTVYFKELFGERVQKLTLDAGFTCPNRDGTKGTGGCAFCNNDAFNPSYCKPEKSVSQQIKEGIEFHRIRYRRTHKYLAYFQAYTNTYADVKHLRKLYEEALAIPEIAGIVIGTRPDCVDDPILNYLEELNKRTYLIVEYGIESCYDETLKRINRGHDFATTIKALMETAGRGIRTGGHLIIGLPGESREFIVRQADILSSLPLNNIKFHQLQIVKNTVLAEEYLKNPGKFTELSLNEYIDLIIDMIERLNPSFIIERIAGEAHPAQNLRPSWSMRYDQILEFFEKRLEERNTWQGRLWTSKFPVKPVAKDLNPFSEDPSHNIIQ